MSDAPITYTWTEDGVMKPLPRFAKMCDRQFAVGEQYRLAVNEERSRATHNHFFASVQDAWENLPEQYADRFASAEHLRKWCLIKAGYRDERSIAVASKAEAVRVAGFIKPMDEFAVVAVEAATVTVYTAKSQSLRAMGKKDFQASKEAVLDALAGMIGTTTHELVSQSPPTAPHTTERETERVS